MHWKLLHCLYFIAILGMQFSSILFTFKYQLLRHWWILSPIENILSSFLISVFLIWSRVLHSLTLLENFNLAACIHEISLCFISFFILYYLTNRCYLDFFVTFRFIWYFTTYLKVFAPVGITYAEFISYSFFTSKDLKVVFFGLKI